uniref:5-formyltetrahydrofolate cyclo-ligase n=1 Tax=Lygus hesperus TaxID=30085 RepID=A0A0A9WX59_LYGHE
MAVQTSKKLLRRRLKDVLSAMSQEGRDQQSMLITEKVLKSPIYNKSRRVGIYLNMPEEVDTDALVRDILTSGKECFVPRCSKLVMTMEKLRSIEDYENLVPNGWGIKEPLLEESRESSVLNGGLDLVIVPGLGFTSTGQRIGRGKGYYDKFLSEMKLLREGSSFATIGIAFKEQMVDEIPTSEHDFRLDLVVTC